MHRYATFFIQYFSKIVARFIVVCWKKTQCCLYNTSTSISIRCQSLLSWKHRVIHHRFAAGKNKLNQQRWRRKNILSVIEDNWILTVGNRLMIYDRTITSISLVECFLCITLLPFFEGKSIPIAIIFCKSIHYRALCRYVQRWKIKIDCISIKFLNAINMCAIVYIQ